ncbi:MAG: hypothetical protein JRD68_08265 [Deltaproteobacteria bacterium]|nr:hypothetical protein [Deltaproteobacteria bacterium]
MTDKSNEEKTLIGKVANYFNRLNVVAIELTGPLKVGDTISIEGATTSFKQTVESMQVQNKSIEEAAAGDEIGIKVEEKAREGDKVYIIT